MDTATALAMDESEDFQSFFLAEHDRLYRTLVLAAGSREDAEDLAQEAMVRVLERWDRREKIRSMNAYLYTIAFNLLKRRRRRDALGMTLLRRARVTQPESHLNEGNWDE